MSREKQIEELKKDLDKMIGNSSQLKAEKLFDLGYRKQSEMLIEFLQMVENVCGYEERLSYEVIEKGIKRQMARKGGEG